VYIYEYYIYYEFLFKRKYEYHERIEDTDFFSNYESNVYARLFKY